MDFAQFEHLLDLHGSDLSRWPPHARDAATELMAEAPEARTALEAMQRLDDALRHDRSAVAPHPHQFAQRLAAVAMRHRQSARPVVMRTAWAAAACAVMAFGLVVGDLLPDRHADPTNLINAAFSTPDQVDVD